jgi:hypothetical protein
MSRIEWLETRDMPAVVFVTTGADSGAGSLRDAIGQANTDANLHTIVIKNDIGAINLESSLGYTGGQDLTIKGNDVVIQPIGGESTFDLLESTGGADLTFERLAFRDGLKGIDIIVPAGATGTLSVTLKQVSILDNVEHGLHIDDLTNSSAAGVNLNVQGSVITGNGSDPDDFDGIRVDERGAGGIVATFHNTIVADNGGDGTELDERDGGDVTFVIQHSSFNHNGIANADDLEDGFDVDEGGQGDIVGDIANSTFNDNFEGGLDINEDDGDDPNDGGNLIVNLRNVEGNDNDDKGLDFNEDNGGNLVAVFVAVEASRNGIFADNLEEGIVLEEAGAGNIVAHFRNVTTNGNGDDGIDVDETGDGNLVASFNDITANDNGAEGIDLDEDGTGAFIVSLHHIVSNDPLDVTD